MTDKEKTMKTKSPETARELTPADYNPRQITEKRQAQLGKSMGKFGDLSGIVYNRRTGRLVCGHQRIRHLAANAKIRKEAVSDEHGTVAIGRIVSGSRASWAAELTGRRARLMELDPHYVDAEVKRWEEMTGRKATIER